MPTIFFQSWMNYISFNYTQEIENDLCNSALFYYEISYLNIFNTKISKIL